MSIKNKDTFLQDTLDHMPVVFFVKDIDDRYLNVNAEFEKLFNWHRKNVIGKTGSDLFPKEVNDTLRLNDIEVIQQRKAKVWIETVYDYQGRPRIYETHKFPYFDDEGNVYAVGGIALEITDKIKAEEQLEANRKVLLRSARMAAVGEMAGGIAHEINNPLEVIHAHHYLMQEMSEKNETQGENWAKNLKVINDAIVRIQRIIKGLLAFARQSTNDPKVETSVSEILAELFELCYGRMARKGVALTFPKIDPKIKIECRPYQISQILLNLLNNAVDVVSSLPERWIQLEFKEKEEIFEFRVIDSGKGIPETIRHKLFESFFTTKEFGFGSGLGLSISRGLALEHNGSLEIDEKAKNTTFILRVPKKQI
ncbi:MAG: hypothetical protein A4S09_16645 [Proteobacteria bacterium SG_bin7]|nr:MAG: hypothetical protein A4S09_16645 [Proteobacteria bacterium SG_bin7]